MPLKLTNRNNVSTAPTGNSVFFNGSNQYLKLPANSSAWTLSGNFTIECWFNTSTTNQNGIFTMNWNGDWNAVYGNGFSLSSNIVVTPQGNTTWAAPSINVWHHIAVVRSGATLTTYLDGVNVGSQTNSNQFGNASTTPGIGLFDTQSGIRCPFPGYISNLRIIKGTALYTSNFTPPTAPLTAIANTALLTCNAPTIIDGSVNNFTITNNNSATVSSVVPFVAIASKSNLKFANRNNVSSAPTGNSVFFNGSNQYLTASRTGGWLKSANNFTLECWVYFTRHPSSYGGYYYSCIAGTADNSTGWELNFGGNGSATTSLAFSIKQGGGPGIVRTFNINTWYHIAVVRSGTTVTLYIDGTSANSTTVSSWTENTQLKVGALNLSPYFYYFPGYISNFRIIDGTALYTANFTPPVSTLTAITNTALLTCNAATIIDGSTNNFSITNNNSATVSSVVPFVTIASKNTMAFKKVYSDPAASYMIATGGDLITISGSYKIHQFTTVGTSSFTVSSVGNTTSIEYLVVGGGGAGGSNNNCGGGGAGGLIYNTTSLSVGTYTITVGQSGSVASGVSNGNNGGNSTFNGLIAFGGGGGGGSLAGSNGGSGGGNGGGGFGGTSSGGGVGLQPTSSYGGFGNNGGASAGANSYPGGGGGGAGAAGNNGAGGTGGNGGNGKAYAFAGAPVYYAGGGGGSLNPGTPGTGGLGGGGNGRSTVGIGSNATGYGSGGGGGLNAGGGAGSPGIILIKYRYADEAAPVPVPNIITNGLVLNLDASNVSSYTGTGTNWYDLSGNNNTGSLTNGPIYTGSFGGGIKFDGVDDYISIGSQNIVGTGTSAFTGEIWWYNNRTLANGDYILPIRIKQDSEFFVSLYNPSGTYNLIATFRGNTQFGIPVTNSDYINKWICMQFVYTGGNKSTASSYKFYINGTQIAIGSNNYGPAGGTLSNCNIIGSDGNNGCNASYSGILRGTVASYRLYTGELTAAQLLQNYNATKARFGL